MTSIRDELCRFIRLNKEEQWIGAYDRLRELERFGEDLIPGLIECLSDGHPDVRDQAVQILVCARPRSDIAVPDLIKLLQDEDWMIVNFVILVLGDFGALAAAAIPEIEPLLASPNEYLTPNAVIPNIAVSEPFGLIVDSDFLDIHKNSSAVPTHLQSLRRILNFSGSTNLELFNSDRLNKVSRLFSPTLM